MIIIGGAVLLFGGIWAFYKFVFNHIGFVILAGLVVTGVVYFNIGSTEIVRILGANEITVAQVYGNPNKCSNGGHEIICSYDDMEVVFQNDKATFIRYNRLNGKLQFRTDRGFYEKVLGMLELPYREPDVANMNEVVWRIPNFGIVAVTSNSDMEVEGIVIHG